MRMRPGGLSSSFLIAAAHGLLAGGALAQGVEAPNRPLSAQEMRAELFGVEMSGYTRGGSGETLAWRECIEPSGRTVYRLADVPARRGRMTVRDDARVCFAYEDTAYSDESCFRANRAGPDRYVFWGDGVFHATRVVRSVKACDGSEPAIG